MNEPKQSLPPSSGKPDDSKSEGLNKATIIALLYLSSFVLAITGLVGFILTLVWKGEVAGTWEESHLDFHFRTFIIGLIGSVIGMITIFLLIGFVILLAVAVWVLARSIMALLIAQKQEPIKNPKDFMLPQ